MRNVINEYLSQFDLDVRKSHDARFVDQKCTPDIVCFGRLCYEYGCYKACICDK